jgi:hypothetical protein
MAIEPFHLIAHPDTGAMRQVVRWALARRRVAARCHHDTNDTYNAWEAYTSMDSSTMAISLLLGIVLFWFVVFLFSLFFFKSALRVPTEAEIELAEEHKHS